MVVLRWISSWEGLFRGAMIVWGTVPKICLKSLNIFDNSCRALRGPCCYCWRFRNLAKTSCDIYWTHTKVEYVHSINFHSSTWNISTIPGNPSDISFFGSLEFPSDFWSNPSTTSILPTQTMHYCEGYPSNYHTSALFDPPRMDNSKKSPTAPTERTPQNLG